MRTLLSATYFAARATDIALCSTPCGRRLKDALLDTILGRQETFKYVSTTTPGWATPLR